MHQHLIYFQVLAHVALSRCRCSAPEQKFTPPIGSLQKQTKTAEEKQRDLMEDIKRKQEKLNQLEVRSHCYISNQNPQEKTDLHTTHNR
jgi:hypothetical protein